VHSNYSFYFSTLSIEALIGAASARGLDALALTDRNLAAAVPFAQGCQAAGLRPIHGLCLDCRAVLLAKDDGGLRAIQRISTRLQVEKMEAVQRTAYSVQRAPTLSQNAEPGTRNPELGTRNPELGTRNPELGTRNPEPGTRNPEPGTRNPEPVTGVWRLLAGEDLSAVAVFSSHPEVLEALRPIVPGGNLHGELAPGSPANPAVESACLRLGLPALLTPRVSRAGATVREMNLAKLLLGMKHLKTAGTLSPEELASIGSPFATVERDGRPEAWENTRRLVDECRAGIELGRINFPAYPFVEPGGAPARLREVAEEGFRTRYRPGDARARARLEMELEVIARLGYADYFLIVWDLVREGRRLGYPCLGRGSAAASLVVHCLGISPVDPIRYDLYFERFLNPERKSPPDIDVDFGTARRDDILAYIYRTFGGDRTAMISTITSFALRGAVREAGKAMGYTETEIGNLSKKIPHYARSTDPDDLAREFPECRALPLDNPEVKRLFSYASMLAGFPHAWGIHCGGVIITPRPLTDYLALTRSANGLVITQPDMRPVEAQGLLKMDILGNRSLDVLPTCLLSLERHGAPPPPVDDLDACAADPATRALIVSGKTMGCFYIESPAMRQLLLKLGVEAFEELVAASSIIRPGVAESGMMQAFIARHRGREKPAYILPELEALLGGTYGVMVYQEDVIKVAHAIAGMSLGEADSLRRAMSGKSRSHGEMERSVEEFVRRAVARGHPEPKVRELARQMASFAGYSFCKSHSAAFATLSFQVAYLKAHHPAEFMAAVLTCGGGFYPSKAYVSEARRLGIAVLPPDIHEAGWEYEGRNGALRTGFMAVRNMERSLAERIVAERERKPFASFLEFYTRVQPSREVAEALIDARAFECFGHPPRVLRWLLEVDGRGTLMPWLAESVEREVLRGLHALADEPSIERLAREEEAVGFPLSSHPAALARPRCTGVLPAIRMGEMIGKRVRLLGIIVAAKRVWVKKSEQWMKFLDMEDETDAFEAVVFPQTYVKYAELTRQPGPLVVTGTVKDDQGSPALEVASLARTG
jgi:DNA-directed DNA polymerase III PolC